MWENRRLEQKLRRNRPQPDDGFLRLAVGRIEADTDRPRIAPWAIRPIVTLALVAAIVAAFAGLGGFSGLKSAATQSRHLSPFVAAALNYCTQQVVVTALTTSPTTASTITFNVNFNQSVIGFTSSDVVIGGTAGATTAVVSGGPQTYNVAVTGMTSAGTVTVMIPANAATNTTSSCATPASNTASVTYSTLAITTFTPDGNSGNGALSGSGAAANSSVTVTVCKTGKAAPCSGSDVLVSIPVTASGTGTFATGNITQTAKHTTYNAFATQGAVTSQTFTFTTTG